ncbi:MAG TPA: hypothetical protein VN046_02535, partial [Stenotrophobium sp.]|nr:hypothetical protein [Stenotrophobium sp.]
GESACGHCGAVERLKYGQSRCVIDPAWPVSTDAMTHPDPCALDDMKISVTDFALTIQGMPLSLGRILIVDSQASGEGGR